MSQNPAAGLPKWQKLYPSLANLCQFNDGG